ncbi:MAG: NAD(P)/FAD-dependent oxidoreductase [Bacteroidota bacterium]
MMDTQKKTLIIGAGLCGLTLAYRLQQAGHDTIVVEARDRVGGRIHTVPSKDGTLIEMGATWLGSKHTALVELINELGITIEEQFLSERAIYEPLSTSPPQLVQLPANSDPSYRIGGGTHELIQRLLAALSPDSVLLQQQVKTIEQDGEIVRVRTATEEFEAHRVVSTLPPHLLLQSVAFIPALPETVHTLASHTHTWMGESIKFGFSFATPFWRSEQTSGTLVSNVGPVNEMYDHSNMETGKYALKGFLNGAYGQLSQEERRELILSQLRKYYSAEVDAYTDYQDQVWSQQPLTYTAYEADLLPHQNNGHQDYRQPFWNGQFYLAGSETANQFPGYMDGAVRSANWIFGQIVAF